MVVECVYEVVILRYMEEGSIRLEYYIGCLCKVKFILLVSINSLFVYCILWILIRLMNVFIGLKLNIIY